MHVINEELLSLIQDKCKYIRGIRNGDNGIEVKLPAPEDERSWISYREADINVEKVIESWLSIGGIVE